MILSFLLSPYNLLLVPVLFYLLPYIRARAIRDVPGPPLAAFSNLWLMYQCRRGRRYLAVDNAHKKYGPLVRIQPNHISIADAEAIPIVYSHTGGWTKRYNNPVPSPFLRPSNLSSFFAMAEQTIPQRVLRCLCLHPARSLQYP